MYFIKQYRHKGQVRVSSQQCSLNVNLHAAPQCSALQLRRMSDSNFTAQLCCATKLPVWHRKLPNFSRVEQLNR